MTLPPMTRNRQFQILIRKDSKSEEGKIFSYRKISYRKMSKRGISISEGKKPKKRRKSSDKFDPTSADDRQIQKL